MLAPDSPHTREFATLYQGLAEVTFLPAGHPDLHPTPETDEPTCFSLRIMRALGLTGSPIPYVEVTDRERAEALDFLFGVVKHHPASLVAIAPSPGGARADLPDSHIANYRRWPDDLRNRLIDDLLSRGYQPVRFGTKERQKHIYANHAEWPGVLSIPDLNVRQLAACMAVIGRYVGTDSADHHLALAVGAESEMHVPESRWFYDHSRHHYGPDAWALAGEAPREVVNVYPRAMPAITS